MNDVFDLDSDGLERIRKWVHLNPFVQIIAVKVNGMKMLKLVSVDTQNKDQKTIHIPLETKKHTNQINRRFN